MTKRCSRCGETKPINEFHRNRTSPDDRHNWCKACVWEYRRSDDVRAARKAYDARPEVKARKAELKRLRRAGIETKRNPAERPTASPRHRTAEGFAAHLRRLRREYLERESGAENGET